MKVSELNRELLQLTQDYFSGAVVKFANENFTIMPEKPLVLITAESVNRSLKPPNRIVGGYPVSYYPSVATFQIDLFSNGKQTDTGMMMTSIVENTVLDDMLAFADFLNSPYVVRWSYKRDIAIIIPNEVRDLTGIVNDTNFQFRSMLEVRIYFTMTAVGYTGTLNESSIHVSGDGSGAGDGSGDDSDGTGNGTETIVPDVTVTPSGGGNPDYADLESEEGYFSNVEINDKRMKEE